MLRCSRWLRETIIGLAAQVGVVPARPNQSAIFVVGRSGGQTKAVYSALRVCDSIESFHESTIRGIVDRQLTCPPEAMCRCRRSRNPLGNIHMKRAPYIYGFLQLVLLAGYGCSDKGGEVLPPNTGPTLVCSPDSGRIGWVFTITGEEFQVPAVGNIVTFNNAVEKRADSGLSSAIYVSVPFGATTGPITVASNQRVFTSRSFKVTERYNPLALNVAWYDLPLPVTASDSTVIDDGHFRRTWQAEVSQDTVHIQRSHSFVEGYAEFHFLLFGASPDQLPQPIRAWVFSIDDTGQRRVDTLAIGIWKIQNWNTNIALSGRFIGRPYWWGPFTFWVTPNNIRP